MPSSRTIGFLHFAHALDHLFMLIFPTAVLGMAAAFGRSYSELLPLSLGGFIAFGAGSLPFGWLGDRISRVRLMAIFFFGTGLAASLTGLARSPAEIAAGLTLLGAFAAIYHPVASAMLVSEPARLGRLLGTNGLFGNLGIAGSALVAGALTELVSWRAAFIVPGLVAIAGGIAFLVLVRDPGPLPRSGGRRAAVITVDRSVMLRLFLILLVSITCGGIIFNATTIAMPKVFDERLTSLVSSPLGIGLLISLVYVTAALAQLCVGPLIDRLPMRQVLLPVAALQVPLLLFAGLADGWPMLIAAVLMMLVVFGQVPVNDAMVARCIADEYRARAYAVRYVVSFGASTLAVPLVASLRQLTGGFQQMFVVLAGLAACVLIAALSFPGRQAAGTTAAPVSSRP